MRVCGVDEVGCASIAGPVFVCAAVADKSQQRIAGVADSKKLSRKRREVLDPELRAQLPFAFGAAGPREIEHLNIYWARFLAMRRAVGKLLRRGIAIDLIIVDGDRTIQGLPDGLKQEAHPKADENFWEVSAASILAKVARDRIMSKLAERDRWRHYAWEKNVGYYTSDHFRGVVANGPTPYHRKTFDLFKYALCRHKEFLASGKTLEDFLAIEAERGGGSPYSGYAAWKRELQDLWKPIVWEEEA